MKKITSSESRDALLRAVKQILRPLVRLLIHFEITFPTLRELLKSVYVEIAGELIEADGNPATHSRIYILTGVHRKDIKRLQQEDDVDTATPNLSLGGELIARWMGQPEYLDDRGNPRPLPRSGSDESPGFEQLVISASKDVRPRAVLDEWLRQGLVSINGDIVELNQQAFIPSANFENLCFYLGRNLRDHLGSAAHNLLEGQPPMLERSVYYGNLSAESVRLLNETATRAGMDLLTRINKEAMRLHEADQGRDDARHRFTLGCYWYQQEKTP